MMMMMMIDVTIIYPIYLLRNIISLLSRYEGVRCYTECIVSKQSLKKKRQRKNL